jgi:hypothetical protein
LYRAAMQAGRTLRQIKLSFPDWRLLLDSLRTSNFRDGHYLHPLFA